MGIEKFVLAACADPACLTIQMCLGETTFERRQEFIRPMARPVRQRCSIPRGAAWAFWCGRLAGGTGGRAVCRWQRGGAPCLGVCTLVGLGDELQVSSTPLIRRQWRRKVDIAILKAKRWNQIESNCQIDRILDLFLFEDCTLNQV